MNSVALINSLSLKPFRVSINERRIRLVLKNITPRIFRIRSADSHIIENHGKGFNTFSASRTERPDSTPKPNLTKVKYQEFFERIMISG